ncbi:MULTISPECIES: hypothetical protein [unclassified Borrelia]|uniref:hypothetical protein n=1 Tax=unclassified Borrelia TaxID=2649934 RepID=UPI001E3D2E32|nr:MULTISPECIES: hypothetical protein [unclassified Borrelia]UGQ16592.1 hypothetical protein LSO06_04565 [Borrelia sp. RT5S]UGQ17738.1 hypothetical protein LSO05_04740 [Borrelia sp. RT1S]
MLLLGFIAKNFHVICRGVEHRNAYISVEVNIDGRVCVLPASLMMSSTDISYAPCEGSNVLVAFVDKKMEHPIILGGGINKFDKDKISISNIVVNKDIGKVAIRNDNASIKVILGEMLDLIKEIKITGSYYPTIKLTYV